MFLRGTFLSLFISLSLPLSLEAKILRILHTNDLHAQISGVQDGLNLGGYAQLKARMEELKEQSRIEGIPVLAVDAGDFSEGGFAYKAGNGQSVFQLMEGMGYDAVALGNHDYLMGAKRLTEILSMSKLPLVAANIKIRKNETVLKEKIVPYRIMQKGDLRIAVVGGTTKDIFYRWVLKNSIDFHAPDKLVNKFADQLRDRADVTIALTHIGLAEDENMVKNGRSIDLVIGGHTHQKLLVPSLAQNKNKDTIGIVQAGEHGKYLGELVVDVSPEKAPGSRVKIISYKLHPIDQKGTQNTTIKEMVKNIYTQLENYYGAEYLYQPLGQTEHPMAISYTSKSFWQDFYTNAIRESAGTDIAFNNHEFMGPTQSAGEITRAKIMSFFPHFFNVNADRGWTIFTAKVSGFYAKQIVKLSVTMKHPFLVSGMTYDLIDLDGEKKAKIGRAHV